MKIVYKHYIRDHLWGPWGKLIEHGIPNNTLEVVCCDMEKRMCIELEVHKRTQDWDEMM